MECVSVQAYPFRKTVRAKRQQWSASACYKLAAKWREGKKNLGSFFLGVFRLNAACQKWRFITSPKETTFSGWWKHDCPDVSAVSDSAGEEGSHMSTKGTFSGERAEICESWTPCPSFRSAVNGNKGLRDFGWGWFNVAKSKCFIDLPSIKQKTRKSLPHKEKYQQNWRIKATFMGTQSNRSWMLEVKQSIMLHWCHEVSD